MKTWERGLSRGSLLAWPAVTFGLSWAILANFGDAAYNGTGYLVVRAVSIIVLVAAQFALTWLVDKWLFKRISPRLHTISLLITFIGFGILRGIGVSAMMFFVGATPEWAVGPRILAAVFQSVVVAMVAASYGTFTSNASELRNLEAVNNHLVQLANHVTHANEKEDKILLEKVRAQLRKEISWSEDALPEQVLSKLGTSIDDVVRPLSKALTQPSEPVLPPPLGIVKVNWKSVWKKTLDSKNLHLGWTSALVFGAFSVPSVWIFGPVGFLLSATTVFLAWFVMWATARAVRTLITLRQRATPIVLATGSLTILVVFWLSYPENLRNSYIAITPLSLVVLGVVPALISISLRESANIADRITHDNQQLAWFIARTNEESRQHRNAVATALHGSVQAALSACAVRLQLSLRGGIPEEEAVSRAKIEAQRAIELTIDFARPAPKLAETLSELRLGWAGVTEIRGSLPTEVLDTDSILARLVADLLVECVLNSVKHAGAQWVEIGVTVGSDRVELVVRNPCRKPVIEGDPGGGTTLLNDSTIEWLREHSNDITTVRAILPFKPTEG